MHVLSTPPAFILSQDQTLRLNGAVLRLLISVILIQGMPPFYPGGGIRSLESISRRDVVHSIRFSRFRRSDAIFVCPGALPAFAARKEVIYACLPLWSRTIFKFIVCPHSVFQASGPLRPAPLAFPRKRLSHFTQASPRTQERTCVFTASSRVVQIPARNLVLSHGGIPLLVVGTGLCAHTCGTASRAGKETQPGCAPG